MRCIRSSAGRESCRIVANGEPVAEGSQDHAMGCVFNLAQIASASRG